MGTVRVTLRFDGYPRPPKRPPIAKLAKERLAGRPKSAAFAPGVKNERDGSSRSSVGGVRGPPRRLPERRLSVLVEREPMTECRYTTDEVAPSCPARLVLWL